MPLSAAVQWEVFHFLMFMLLKIKNMENIWTTYVFTNIALQTLETVTETVFARYNIIYNTVESYQSL